MMNRRLVLVIVLAIVAYPMGFAAKPVKDNIGIKWLDSNVSVYDSLQKKIHNFAEPGFLEYQSSRAIADHLVKNGFTVEWGVGDIPTAFVATYGSGKPVIGMLGEYDALPWMSQDTSSFRHPLVEGAAGHACGHNLLGTATAASAIAVSKWLGEGHAGTVKYYGCPAEEGGGGKHYMTVAGCFDDCDAVFDWHPDNRSMVTLSPWQANMRVNFNFHGISAHAGGAPWNGRSALDAVEAFDNMMNMMREHVPEGSRIHYIITNGGQAPNVVPDEAQVVYYFRHKNAEVVRDIFERAVAAAKGAAMGTGTTMDYEIVNASYEKLVNRRLADVLQRNLLKVGGVDLDERESEFIRAIRKSLGDEQWQGVSNFKEVASVVAPAEDVGLSSDVGHVSQVAPLASLRYVTMPEGTPLHTWPVAAVAGSTVGTKVLLNVAKIFYWSALDLFQSPSEVKAVREEFEQVKGKDYRFKPLMDRRPPRDMNVKGHQNEELLRFKVPQLESTVYYDAVQSLLEGCECETAVVLIHGWSSGIGRYKTQMTLIDELPGTYVVAPLFPRRLVMDASGFIPDGRAVWNDSWPLDLTIRGLASDDWRGGGDANGTSLSSFDVVDKIFEILSDRILYPNLKRIWLCGFSAGGQFVDRYVAVGKGVCRDDVEIKYLAMSPSTWLYFDESMDWHYGISGRPRYCDGLTPDQILSNLESRQVWKACGTEDVTTPNLDQSPEAMAGGLNRYDRFHKYQQYLDRYPLWEAHSYFFDLEGIAHSNSKAYQSQAVLKLMKNE